MPGGTTGDADGTGLFAGDAWFDPVEVAIRERMRGFIEELLEQELTALWPEIPAQRCTVHKHRNLLAHVPDALHKEVTAGYTDLSRTMSLSRSGRTAKWAATTT